MKYETAVPLGSGGVGEVYKAYDSELQRFVALKYLKRDDPVLAERLLQEARLQARIEHDAVCKVYAVGTDEGGRPFIAMQYIEGRTLEAAAAELSLDEKLAVLQRVAEAVHVAHESGLVHRDLKPDNIMLERREGSAPKPYVLDFGLAREREARGVTRTGVIAGTPAYMAPEQARGEIRALDRRCDVYALGATLYRLLAGRPPFEGGDLDVILKAVHSDPPPLRSHDPAIPKEVETVVMQCLEKEPARRYESAQALAQDLGRVRAGQAPVARRPGRVARLLRRSRRNPALSIVTGLALLCVAALVFVLARGGRLATPPSAERPVPSRRAFAVLGLRNSSGRAEAAWIGAALGEMLTTELATGGGLRAIPGEAIARATRELQIPGAEALAPDTLARIRANLGTDVVLAGSYLVLRDAGDRVRLDLRVQDAANGETIAVTSQTASQAALPDLVRAAAADVRAALGVRAPARGEQSLGEAQLWSRPEAARLYSEGLEALRSGDALAAREPLERAALIEPSSALVQAGLSQAWATLGYDERARSAASRALELSATRLDREQRLLVEASYREAARDWARALEIEKTLFVFFPDNVDYGLRLARAQTTAGRPREAFATLEALGRLPLSPGVRAEVDLVESDAADAAGDFRRAKDAATRAAQAGKQLGRGLLVGRALWSQANALRHLGDPAGALADFREAERLARAAGDVDSVARAVSMRAGLLWTSGDAQGALELYQEAGALSRSIGHQRGVASALVNACSVLDDLHRRAEAGRACQGALEIFRETNDKRGMANVLNSLGSVLWAGGQTAESIRTHEEAVELTREVGDSSRFAVAAGNLADSLIQTGDLERARRLLEEALVLDRRGGDRTSIAYRLIGLGQVRFLSADRAGARQAFEEAQATFDQHGEKLGSGFTRMLLGMLSLDDERLAEAEASFRSAVEVVHSIGDVERECQALGYLARALVLEQRLPEAERTMRQAHALLPANAARDVRDDDTISLARVEAATGHVAEARHRLATTIAQLERIGLATVAFEARLTSAEIGAAAGDPQAPAALAALAQEAEARGLRLIAAQARRAAKASTATRPRPAASSPRKGP